MVTLSLPGKRVAAIYGATFFALGISLPYYPLLLADRGMGDTEIAIIIAVPMIVRALVSSLLGILADLVGNRGRVLVIYSGLAAIAFSSLYAGSGFFALLSITVTTSLFANASTPVIDALATTVVRHGGGDYGRMRMWGSISFVIANLAGGSLIGWLSRHAIFWMLAAAYWGAVVLLVILPPKLPPDWERGRGRADAVSATATRDLDDRTIRPPFWRDGVLVAGLAGASLIQASHAMVYGFSSLYWQASGFSGGEVGIFWGVGVLAEILMFYVSGRLFAAWGPGQMMLLSGLAAMARWVLFPLVHSFPAYVGLQCLHALTFACCHLAVMRLIMTRVADRQAASVQGLYATTGALTMATVTLISGPLFRAFGGTGFQLMAIVVLLGLAPALFGVGLQSQARLDLR